MGQTPKRQQSFILTVGQILLKNRWLVLVGGPLIVVTVETIERWPAVLTLDKHFVTEFFFYGLVGPLIVWGLLTMLERSLSINAQMDQIQAEAAKAERRRIARDLHDKLAQNLGYLHLKLDQLASLDKTSLANIKSIQTDLEQMRQIADHTYRQVRGMLDFLRNEPQIPEDLAIALQQQAQAMASRTGLDIKVDCQNDIQPLCPIIKYTIIDIAEEALTNISKHARTGQAKISLACDHTDARLTISDNGPGFTVNNNQKTSGHYGGHYGLEIMSERAEEVGGKLEIASEPGQGTQLIAQFPNIVVSRPLLQKCEQLQCVCLAKPKYENSIS